MCIISNSDPFDELVRSCNVSICDGANTNALGKIMMAALQYTDEVYVRVASKICVYRKAYNFYLYWIDRYVNNESDRQTVEFKKTRV